MIWLKSLSMFVVLTTYVPALLRLQDQVPLVSFVSLTMVTMKYFLWMCPPPLMLSILLILSLLQQALPSSRTGCTTFWQTQVCVRVCLYEVGMCAYMHVFMRTGR